ncbi:MAG TPA: peptidoglycan bridge formation glycyltransferase FemA/FemB family protein [Chloroflexi bacterium]|nr:peptidoglycan bridge formation glycyltransferase FemA/FemB family protein [Chloroflexota bacterium]
MIKNSALTATQRNQSTIDDPAAWDRWVDLRSDGHPLQLSGWGQLKARFGWTAQTIVMSDAHGVIVAGAQMLLRRAFGVTLAYIPRGPLVEWTNAAQVAGLMALLRAAAQRAGAAVLKIEPELPDTPVHRARLYDAGFTPSAQTVQPPSTIFVDLSGGEDAVLAAMKSKWRYNVRLAERKGVTVRAMTRADLPSFHQLMHETGARDGFAVHSDAYFTAAFDLLTPEHAIFLLAEYAGAPLASIVVALAGKTAVYLWGASSERERSRMPNHALQWAGMRWALARGATRYDLWGIPDELGRLAMAVGSEQAEGVAVDALPIAIDALPDDGLWGVYRFKQGFGGRVLRTVGAWDMPIDPLGARFYRLGLSARQWQAAASQARRRRQRAPAPVGEPSPPLVEPQRVVTPSPLQLERIDNAARWREALAQTPAPHVLQSWEWGEVKAQTGWRAERLLLQTPEGVAAFQFLTRQLFPALPVRIGYAPKGPALDWSNLELVDVTLAAIETHARRTGCLFVKIDPDVREDTTVGRLTLHALQRRGWQFSAEQIQFKNTAITSLTVGEDALLAAMKSKWRYNIRLAEKRGVTVRLGQAGDLPTFYALYAETGARDGFLIRPQDYYLTTWQRFLQAQAEADNPAGGALLLAEHPDDPQPVAGLFLLRYGATAWYFYGASSERHRRDMPNHLLQWEALRWARAHGCTIYDWWGAPTVLDDPEDNLQGVWQFKQGFGAEFQPHIGAWDFAASPLGYRLLAEGIPLARAAFRRVALPGSNPKSIKSQKMPNGTR